MIELKDLGNYESIPQIANDIIAGNVAALDKHFEQGWDIEDKIALCEYSEETPLYLALLMESFGSVKWLVKHGVNLNDNENPSFVVAVRYCNEDIIRYLVNCGADVNKVNDVGIEAFGATLWGEKFDNLSLIHELGHSVQRYGGAAFRHEASEITRKAFPKVLEFFVSHGVDINFNKSDDVFSFNETPLCAAARYSDLSMCKYLVEQGADVAVGCSDGMRPYSIAVELGKSEMANYFKSLEPVEIHDMENKLLELKSYRLPKPLVEFLQSDNLHFDFTHNEHYSGDIPFIEFFSLIDVVPIKVGKHKLLRISKETGDYEHIHILWNPKDRCVSYYDISHGQLGNIAPFDAFASDMAECVQIIPV